MVGHYALECEGECVEKGCQVPTAPGLQPSCLIGSTDMNSFWCFRLCPDLCPEAFEVEKAQVNTIYIYLSLFYRNLLAF